MKSYPYFEEVNQGLLKLAAGHDRVLDVGCGLGALGEERREQGCFVVGLDVSEEAIAESGPYRFYLRWVFPVETAAARLWKSLFAFQFVFYAVLTEAHGDNSED